LASGFRKKVGISIGGLGHVGIKIAKLWAQKSSFFTTSPSKLEDAKRLGVDEEVLSSDEEQMSKYYRCLHFIMIRFLQNTPDHLSQFAPA